MRTSPMPEFCTKCLLHQHEGPCERSWDTELGVWLWNDADHEIWKTWKADDDR